MTDYISIYIAMLAYVILSYLSVCVIHEPGQSKIFCEKLQELVTSVTF